MGEVNCLELVAIGEHVGEVLSDVNGLMEESEDGTAGTGHGGVDGTEVVESLLDGTDLGVDGEDAALKVVGEQVAPRLDGLHDDIAAADLRTGRGDEQEGFFR